MDVVVVFVGHQEVEDPFEVGDGQELEFVQESLQSSLEAFAAQQLDLFSQGGLSEFFDVDKVHLLVGLELVLVFQLLLEHLGFE